MTAAKRSMAAPAELVLGVDVGTSSARAGVFALDGRMLGHGSCPLDLHSPQPDFHEQSSDNVWKACGTAIRSALDAADADPGAVAGLSFDATACSLVALDAEDRPVTVSPSSDDRWNVILWMDHRATEEAERVNATGHRALKYLGGRISPEMAIPKLRWIKTHLPRTWARTARFLDLADFLGYRSTGVDARSVCTTVCKWAYLAHEPSGVARGLWPRDLFASMELDDLLENERQGREVRPLGERLGPLRADAAEALGLRAGIAVGVGIIDAHAGGLGLLGGALGRVSNDDDGSSEERLESSLALIGGTSSCHMAVSRQARYVEGVWGPYFSAMVPGMWLTEGGQSATGSLIDHVIDDAGATAEVRERAASTGRTVYAVLNEELLRRSPSDEGGVDPALTAQLHLLPYFHGNRSPRSDPSLRGVVSGLSLDAGVESLARRYLAAVQAVAYGTRHIIESLNAAGYRIDSVFVTGGGTKNSVWLQEHADVTNCALHLPAQAEAVLLGAAILAAVAAGKHGSVLEAMAAMGATEKVVHPRSRTRDYHEKKYRVFHRMYGQFMELRDLMA